MYTEILVRFAELSTKGKNKMTFVRKLENNIIKLIGAQPKVEYDRIFLDFSEKNMEGLKYIFGIQSWSPVIKSSSTIDNIEKNIMFLIDKFNAKTFKIECKRNWKDFPMSSMDVNNHFGKLILKNKDIKVDVKNPEVQINIEIRKNFTYIFVEKFKGLGGYPTGINGKVIHLISGGIDSPLAALEMMKRGIRVDFINFITPPHTDEKTVDKVDRIIKHLMKYQGKSVVYRSNYTDLMNLIGLTTNQAYKITLMRRSFYRIASIIAKNNHYLGISNGDNLGQVASQTLESIMAIQDQSLFPIYRPLLTKDKIEIINKSKKVGTYEISIEKANESCEMFAPKNPVIKPSIYTAEKLEKELSTLFTLEEKNINDQIEIFTIKK